MPHKSITRTSSTSSQTSRSFDEIHLNTLRLNSVLPFTLYTRIEGEYIVYRRENLPFTFTQKQALIENKLETLYLSAAQSGLYQQYLRENVTRTIADKSLPLDERAGLFYRSSRELTKQVFELPLGEDQVELARTLVLDNMKFLSEGRPTLHALMSEMEARPSLWSHALNVSQYGLALAWTLGIEDSDELESIGLGLICQDLGMLKISENLVFKTGPLSFEEWSMVKRHPTFGLEAVDRIPNFPEIARTIVFGHHERLDGSGYPRGLEGEELSIHIRIASLVDVFTSLTCNRPFRDASTSFEALRSMTNDMVGSFDPKLLDAFVKVLGTES